MSDEEKKDCGNSFRFPDADVEQDSGNAKISTDEAPAFDSPVNLHVHHIRKRQTDIDGLSIKATLDGLVAGGILPDDSPEWIKSITTTASKGAVEKTIFRFEEI